MLYHLPDQKTWIFGDLQIFPSSKSGFPNRAKELFEKPARYFFEHDPQVFANALNAQNEQGLKARFSPIAWTKLQESSPARTLEMNPLGAFFSIRDHLMGGKLGSVQNYLAGKSFSNSGQIQALENATEIAQNVSAIDDATISHYIENLPSAAHLQAELDSLFDAWLAGDEARMKDNFLMSSMGSPYCKNDRFRNRNDAWAKEIVTSLSYAFTPAQDSIFVLPLEYLLGEDSVIERIKARPFRLLKIA